jgi:hypothetical protein
MDKDRIFYDLEASGFPCLKITDDIRIDDISPTEGGVLFEFSFYGSDARVQYEIDGNNNFKFLFSEILDGILSSSFEGFYNENEGLLKEIFFAIKDEL